MYKLLCLLFILSQPVFSHDEPIYCQLSDRITEAFCKDMQKKYNLHCTANSGQFLYNVNSLHLTFTCIKNVSVADGRNIIVDAVQDLVKRVNGDPDIRPYLSHYPFSPKDICISISFYDPSYKRVPTDFLALIVNTRNYIYYDKYQENRFFTVFYETFDIAQGKRDRENRLASILSQIETKKNDKFSSKNKSYIHNSQNNRYQGEPDQQIIENSLRVLLLNPSS